MKKLVGILEHDAEWNLELHEHDERRGQQLRRGLYSVQGQRCVCAGNHDDLFLADLVPQQDDRACGCGVIARDVLNRDAFRDKAGHE